MTKVMCSGQQDRDTTTSETHPYRPPSKTRNCYIKDGFDRSSCGTTNDGACQELDGGSSSACFPDSQGGYCKVGNKYYVSAASSFVRLSQSELLNRYSNGGDTNETNREVNRALNNQERRFTNRIRELQIMGQDPIPKRKKNTKGGEKDTEVHNYITDLLFNIGIGISLICFLISMCIILIQK